MDAAEESSSMRGITDFNTFPHLHKIIPGSESPQPPGAHFVRQGRGAAPIILLLRPVLSAEHLLLKSTSS
jgi:hypothetical protein